MKIYAAFGLQVGETLTRFIEGRLQMQLYAEENAGARPWHRSFLDYAVNDNSALRRGIAVAGSKHRDARTDATASKRRLREPGLAGQGWL